MEGLRRHVERLSAASGVVLRLEDLPTGRFKPGVWHPVLNASLARCARGEVTWRTPAEALAALQAACEAHVAAEQPQPPAQQAAPQAGPPTQQASEAAYEARLLAFVRDQLATRRSPSVLLSRVGQQCPWAGARGKPGAYAQFMQARPRLFRLVQSATGQLEVWLTQWSETDYEASLAAVLRRAPGAELELESLATQCPMTPSAAKHSRHGKASALDTLGLFLRARPHLFELVPHESPGRVRVRLATAQAQLTPPLQPPPQLRSTSPAAEAAAAKPHVQQTPSQLPCNMPAAAAVAAPSSCPPAPAAIQSPAPSLASRPVTSDAAAAMDPPAAPTAVKKAPQRRLPSPSRRRPPSPRHRSPSPPRQQRPLPPRHGRSRSPRQHRPPLPRRHRSRSRSAERRTASFSAAKTTEQSETTLHVRHLPLDATAAEVAAFFGSFGPLRIVVLPELSAVAARLNAPPTWRYARVTFAEWQGANAAFTAAQNSELLLRPGALPIQAAWSGVAFVPDQCKSLPAHAVWVAPPAPLPRLTRAAGDSGDDRGRKRSRSREHRSRSRSRSRQRDRRSGDAPPPRGRDEGRRRSSRSRSRSRSRGRDHRRREDDWRRREASPPLRVRDRGHSGTAALYAPGVSLTMPQTALPQPLPQPVLVPVLPPPPALPVLPLAMAPAAAPMLVPQVQYRSFVTCGLLSVAAGPIAVVGKPLCGAPALPRPLALELHYPASQVESMSAQLPPNRISVVALVGEDEASTAALRALAAQLAAPAAQPGGEAWAAGSYSPDGAAHFLFPPGEAAGRLILAAKQAGVELPQFIAEVIAVSFLRTDAAVAAAENTRVAILAALQASGAMSL